jgi:nucleoid-associated protein YgaU
MATESDMMGLETKHRRWPQVENKVNSGQLLQILTLVLSLGGVLVYQRTETEAIRRDAAVQKVQVETIAAAATEDKARALREGSEQKQALQQNLTKIEGKVDAVTVVVQQLSTQIAISQGLQQGATGRRP